MPRYNIFVASNPNTSPQFFINKDAANSVTFAKTLVAEADWSASGSLVHTIQIVTSEANMPAFDEETKQLTSLPGEWSNLFNQHGYIPTEQELQLAGFDNYVSTDYYN